ncbi:substrate-binding domain-containing protein [Ralstonia pseudosolanacearum]|uniref:ABC transporter substrate-binding protein n=1 Tax=Ralstonia pseudosolanacearum TaxID=1310165 RepID=UPI001FF9397A|nr:substrate-binding domain-containing protein [Ralstonia pseudosolanacearum]
MKQAIGGCVLASVLWLAGLPLSQAQTVPRAWKQWLATASARHPQWSGPRSGPRAVTGVTLAVISEDLRNGGILGVTKGIKEAAGAIGWGTRLYDAGGTPAGRARAVASALALQPGGVIVVGVDARELQPQLQPFAERGIPMVGWHVSPFAGPIPGSPVAVNISTDPVAVARVTAMATIAHSGGRAGIVVFTDSNFQIAKAKAAAMVEVIRACHGCELLEVRDVAISRSAELMPAITRELLARYGDDWTDTLAINDIYFDYATAELNKAGRPAASMRMLSAGDGSAAAFTRIRAGTFQVGTVAEPLSQQGWQLVDELNRLLAHAPLSGYVAPVHLVSQDNIAFDGGPQGQYDPDNGYRNIYRHIWKP